MGGLACRGKQNNQKECRDKKSVNEVEAGRTKRASPSQNQKQASGGGFWEIAIAF